MADHDSTAAIVRILEDALQRLGRARLALDLARDMFMAECTTAGTKVAAAADEVRSLIQLAQTTHH